MNHTTEQIIEKVPCGTCITTITKDENGVVVKQDVQIVVDESVGGIGIGTGL